MLKLKDVSKFYYNKGVIASGFSKVNLELKIGEFVAIVGESGSGKSTLLNVISGLDSYEEGEMYINGEETSHYREVDFENYRKKYVSNIFQAFNLVNSYTVYQNIELVLLLNGYKKKEVKDKVLELIKKVNLTKYKNTKVSKLSGGQKQRVAIARALAKETPIIVCDEPTGNLDSKSAKEVIKLLKEVSKDKLVIIVTHNFQEIEDIATRVIKMHDGRIVSDKSNDIEVVESDVVIHENRGIGLKNIIRLGIRNTFNIIPKFILMFIVFLFITVSLLTEYGSMKKNEYEEAKTGENYFFNDLSDTRIIIKKQDLSTITDSEYEQIKKISNVKEVAKSDVLMDDYLWFQSKNGEFYFQGKLRNIDSLDKELAYGRMPENENEVVVLVSKYDYFFTDLKEDALAQEYNYNDLFNVKVVGVAYLSNNSVVYNNECIYGTSALINKYMKIVNRNNSDVKVKINDKNYVSENYYGHEFNVIPSDRIDRGKAIGSENINYTCKDYNCVNRDIKVMVDNLYYQDELNLKVSKVYNEKNVNSILGINKDNQGYGSIYINQDDYDLLFNKDNYQSSVYVDDIRNIDTVSQELEDLGYTALQIRKTFNNDGSDVAKILKIIKLVLLIALVITLFFISYFVIKLILKSRNIYFSTLRILGGNLRQVKKILDIELLINSTLAYLSYIGISLLVKYNVIKINFIKDAVSYLEVKDYLIMYIILIGMSYLISSRFASKIFKKSAMHSYREEV